jgi:hypothetical protein
MFLTHRMDAAQLLAQFQLPSHPAPEDDLCKPLPLEHYSIGMLLVHPKAPQTIPFLRRRSLWQR